MKVLMLVENDFEDLELFYPYYRLKEEGWEAKVASSSTETKSGKRGDTITPDLTYDAVTVEEFSALVIKGGK